MLYQPFEGVVRFTVVTLPPLGMTRRIELPMPGPVRRFRFPVVCSVEPIGTLVDSSADTAAVSSSDTPSRGWPSPPEMSPAHAERRRVEIALPSVTLRFIWGSRWVRVPLSDFCATHTTAACTEGERAHHVRSLCIAERRLTITIENRSF